MRRIDLKCVLIAISWRSEGRPEVGCAANHMVLWNVEWLWLGFFFGVDAASTGAETAVTGPHGVGVALDDGVPLSAPWSCLGVGLAQS